MSRHPPSPKAFPPSSARSKRRRLLGALERFVHVEAASGIVLLAATAAALVWANSAAASSYEQLWRLPLTIGVGAYAFTESLHFWINDALMTVFFLVVGLEIRREIHDGALQSVRLASLPLAAAAGGVAMPALVYLAVSSEPDLRAGWAVPTATDIAFAVGVLALLGRSIPRAVRVFLLAIAIIDDIAAVIVIAVFYGGGIEPAGFAIAGAGVAIVLGLQRAGVGAALAYVVPGALVWLGLLRAGAHPALAGVALGLLTPVAAPRARLVTAPVPHTPPPVERVQAALHPWVAYGVIPLFALANAGVGMDGVDVANDAAARAMLGIAFALWLGKPVGIVLGAWLAVRSGACRLPAGLTWRGVALCGLLGGIGFTMSLFIATLAFDDTALLAAAKAGVLLGSLAAGVSGLVAGLVHARRRNNARMP